MAAGEHSYPTEKHEVEIYNNGHTLEVEVRELNGCEFCMHAC